MCNYLQKSFLFFLFLCALPQVYAMENNDQQQTEEEKKLTSYLSTLDATILSELADNLIEHNKSIKNENVVKRNSYMLAQIGHEFSRRGDEIAGISDDSTVMKMTCQKKDLMDVLLFHGVDISPRRFFHNITQLPPQDNGQDKINQIFALIQSQNKSEASTYQNVVDDFYKKYNLPFNAECATNNNSNLLLEYKPKPEDKDCEKKHQ